jgi:two-component system, LytTR family, sensor kinase
MAGMRKWTLNRKPLVSPQLALLSIVGFWVFYLIIVSLRAAVMDFPNQFELISRRVVVAAVGVLITGILCWFLVQFDRKPLGHKIAAAFIAAVPAALAIAVVNHVIFNVIDPINLFEDPEIARQIDAIEKKIGYTSFQDILESAIVLYYFLIAWASLFLAIGYAREVREAERKTSRFAQAAQDAELRSLRYQVNPHFLFNTLNSLSSLVMTGKPKEAEAMIQNLSNFYRTSLSSDPLEDVTLAEEVELQRLYLEIESVRYPKRLRVNIDIPDDLMHQHVPALILQPLVENAIKYGVSRATRPVQIAIQAAREGSNLILSVTDDGEPLDASHVGGNGIGLVNVRDRLEARYKSAARLDTQRVTAGGFIAMLTLPLSRKAMI